ncbi:hypothetical protein K440DRAFT_194889 [Wilcoxina mikolae CBS 423.85]|nr:hypothetical protein K440DRAFT_194889 [Wilcoxina mikolae CBS 423.85]
MISRCRMPSIVKYGMKRRWRDCGVWFISVCYRISWWALRMDGMIRYDTDKKMAGFWGPANARQVREGEQARTDTNDA